MSKRARARLGGLDDLIRPDTTGAHPHAADGAVDDGFHALEVDLEAAGPNVVGVADDPPVGRGLTAEFANFGHDSQ